MTKNEISTPTLSKQALWRLADQCALRRPDDPGEYSGWAQAVCGFVAGLELEVGMMNFDALDWLARAGLRSASWTQEQRTRSDLSTS